MSSDTPQEVGALVLRSSNLEGVVSTKGAWLESLTYNGKNILYPKSNFTLEDGSVKLRGGCHVCLPNFGPGGDSGLPQHGFGRELSWEVVTKTDDSVELLLDGGSEAYAGLKSRLQYELREDTLTMRLCVTNNGETPLRVSPGFHPYFQTSSDVITLDDREIPAGQPHETEFLTSAPAKLHIGDATYNLASENLPQWVAWTDRLGPYFCVEPTQAGYAFLNPSVDDELLETGESREWSLTLTVR